VLVLTKRFDSGPNGYLEPMKLYLRLAAVALAMMAGLGLLELGDDGEAHARPVPSQTAD
jgi:hypothetical protein